MKTVRLLLQVLLVTLLAAPAFAQGGATSSISGVVVDSGGGVIPGATVVAKNDATAGSSTAVSQGNGTFTIPSLNVGMYTVTVSLQGFKTAILKDVQVSAGGPANVKAVLEVGGLAETVVVEGASALIQTQSSAVATTLTSNQILNLPVASRNALDFIPFLPGVQTATTNRDSIVNGLPQSSINITVDGVSVQDNYLKTDDGFFARMSPRLDSVEEVTVTTAGNGVDASAMGSTQIRFTTRSGSNTFTGSAYDYFQSDTLNTNSYFNDARNLPKGPLKLNQPGIRVGGPIVIPKLFDGHDKAFFFVNYEEFRQPSTLSTNSNFMTNNAFNGIYQYQTTSGVQTVNLYQLAAQQAALNPANAAAFTTTPDPLIFKLLQDINAATGSGGTVTALAGNFVAQRYSFQQEALSHNRYPTFRVDYNISQRHRLNMSYNFNRIIAQPDTTNTRQATFPGFPVIGYQLSDRYTFQTSMRSTLSSNLINEVRVGSSGGPTKFNPNSAADMWSGPVANQGGYFQTISAAGITNAGSNITSPSAREGSTRFFEDTLSYLKGAHSITMGMNFTQVNVWLLTQTRVPSITFGIVTGDPVLNTMFTAGNFPGSSTANRTEAQNLYAVLTGRVSGVNGTGRLDAETGKYVYNGDSMQEGHMREFDLFAQDSWKIRPNLSLNVGMRYAIQRPFTALNGSYSTSTLDDAWGISGNKPGCDPSAVTQSSCNLFNPTATGGIVPTFQNLAKGVDAFSTDWNNFGASIGANWTPAMKLGFLKPVFGQQGESSFSGGWNRAYERHGMSDFTDVFAGNPGLTTGANRNASNGNLGSTPLLLRNGYLGPPASCPGTVNASCMAVAPSYPIPTTVTGSLNIFDPGLQVPYSDTYTVGLQRQIGSKSALEVRYVGSRNREQWTTYNYNEVNILDNGFLNEFKLAQANLYANIANGKGNTFAYMGPGTGTSPLPIYLAYFSGLPSSQATDSTKYTSANFASSNYYNALSAYSPNPFTPAGTSTNNGLNGNATFRANAVAAGLSRNFFYANPDVLGGSNVTGNGGYTTFNSIQTQFRRRLSNGFQFDANYAFGKAWESTRYSFRVDRVLTRNSGTPGDVTHAMKGTTVYELPFGQGKRWANDSGATMDRIVGGWQVSATGRVQSGRLVDLGNVRVVGMNPDLVHTAFKLRKVSADTLYMWPDDIIQNTIKAYSRDINGYTQGAPTGRYFAPANGPDCIEKISNTYGECGVRSLVVTGPLYRQVDLSFIKLIRLVGSQNIQVRFDFLNAFNTVNFTPVSGIGGTATSDYLITQANNGSAVGRTIQFVMRYNW